VANDWGTRYFGDWHSAPSPRPDDAERATAAGSSTRRAAINYEHAEISSRSTTSARTARSNPSVALRFIGITPSPSLGSGSAGISPVRQALIARKALPEQTCKHGKAVVQRIRIGSDATAPAVERASDVDSATRERTLRTWPTRSKGKRRPGRAHATVLAASSWRSLRNPTSGFCAWIGVADAGARNSP